MSKKSEKELREAQAKASNYEITVFEFIFWCSVPYLLCQFLHLIGEIRSAEEAQLAGLIGTAAAVILNLFLILIGSYRLVWKRTKTKDESGGNDSFDNEESSEEGNTYDLRVRKDFGDTLKRNEKHRIFARMVEIGTDGKEKSDLGMTRKLLISSPDGLSISSVAMSGEYISATITVPEAMNDQSTATVSFELPGIYHLDLRFKLELETEPIRIRFPEQKPSHNGMYLDVIAGDNGRYKVLFVFENAVCEPKDIRFVRDSDFEITSEPAEYERSYYAVIVNRSGDAENKVFAKPESVTIGIQAEFETEGMVEGYFQIDIHPEGLLISCSEIEKGRMVIHAYEDENATEFDYKIRPTGFHIEYAMSETTGGVTTARFLCGKPLGLKFYRLTGDAEYMENFNKTFRWSINRRREEDGDYSFVPGEVLAQDEEPYIAEMKISCTVGGEPYEKNIPILLKGKTIPKKPEKWIKEMENLKKDIQFFGLGENEQLRSVVRGAQTMSADELCMLRRAILTEAMYYYKKEGQYFQSLGDSLARYEFAYSALKWVSDQAFTYSVIYFCHGNPYPEAFISPLKDLVVDFLGKLWQSSFWGEPLSSSWADLGHAVAAGWEKRFAYDLRNCIVTKNLRKAGGALAVFMAVTWIDKYYTDKNTSGDVFKTTVATFNAAFSTTLKLLFFAQFKNLMQTDENLRGQVEKLIGGCLEKLPGYDPAGATEHMIGVATKYLTEVVGVSVTVFTEYVEKQGARLWNAVPKAIDHFKDMDITEAEPGYTPELYPDDASKKKAKEALVNRKAMKELVNKEIFDLDIRLGSAVLRINLMDGAEAIAGFVWDITFGIFLPARQPKKVQECDQYLRESNEILGELSSRLDAKAEEAYYRAVDARIQGKTSLF